MSKYIQRKTDTTLSAAVVAAALEKEARPIVKRIAALKLVDKDGYKTMQAELRLLNELGKRAKQHQDEIVMPILGSVERIKELFSPFRSFVNQTIEAKKEQMAEFLESSKAKKEQLATDFKSGKIKKVSTLVAHTNALEVSGRKTWTAVAVDASKTPRQYLLPDMPMIRQALAAGKHVPGWKWEQVETVSL